MAFGTGCDPGDSSGKRTCRDGTAVLVVTHDAKVAAKTKRVLFMQDGKIVSELVFGKEEGDDLDIRAEKVMRRMRQIGI